MITMEKLRNIERTQIISDTSQKLIDELSKEIMKDVMNRHKKLSKNYRKYLETEYLHIIHYDFTISGDEISISFSVIEADGSESVLGETYNIIKFFELEVIE